jgi:hypothetical protein
LKPAETTKAYKGYTIKLNSFMSFEVSGPGIVKSTYDDDYIVFQSYDQATRAIDNLVKTLAAQARVASKLALPVVTKGGLQVNLTGINVRERRLNGVHRDENEVYPAVPWLVDLLVEAGRLQVRRDAIMAQARKYRISTTRPGYGIYHSDEQYDEAINELKAEHDKVTALAKKDNPT